MTAHLGEKIALVSCITGIWFMAMFLLCVDCLDGRTDGLPGLLGRSADYMMCGMLLSGIGLATGCIITVVLA